MAKRARGTRPGQRGRIIRQGGRPAPTSASNSNSASGAAGAAAIGGAAGLTAAEEAQAAALESRITAEERAGQAPRAGGRSATGDSIVRSRGRESWMLATRTAEELVVVRRDLRHILLIDGGLVAVLVLLWTIGSATGIIRF